MSYIGSPPASQAFAPGTDTFSGNGSQTAFALSRNVATVNDILVVVNNVEQQTSAYTVSVSTLTFSAAPSSGTNNIYVRYLSTNLVTIAPQQASVTQQALDVASGGIGTGAVELPSGTTAQRPSSPQIGYTRVNSTTGYLEYWDGSDWATGGGGGGGSPATPTTEGTVYGYTTNATGSYLYSTMLGYNVSATGSNTVAIGLSSTAAYNGTALGMQAQATSSSGGSLAVGRSAKSYAEGATAIGYDAYVQSGGTNSVAIGRSVITNFPNSIVLTASGSGLTAPNTGVFIDSMRDESAGSPDKTLKYNTTTKEIFYGDGGGGGSTFPASNSATINQDITVTAGNNAMLIGPITFGAGYSITVESGANFVLIQ
jgi:hypothetical protein